MVVTAYWTTGPQRGELRTEAARAPGAGEVLVKTICSGISRGTELLVHRGGVPPAVAAEMRAPFQAGDFPYPVKYGYLSVGEVVAGPPQLRGERVFCLHPHQDRYVVPANAVTPIPQDVPNHRALLAGAVETAINGLWEAAPRYGDGLAVIGLGLIGAAVAALVRHFPLARLEVIDTDPTKGEIAERLGLELRTPQQASTECDLVIHCSATGAGLAHGLELLGEQGELIEMSWYGATAPEVPLGAQFHSRRLSIRASQVGAVAAARRARRTPADRLRLAMAALADPAFDALLGEPTPFHELPQTIIRLAAGEPGGLCPVVTYEGV